MTNRSLKIALAVSVALNLFGIAGGAAAWIVHQKAEARAASQSAQVRQAPVRQILAGMDPAVRDRVRAAMRASAKAARPDFQQAREARQQAIVLAASPTGGAVEITALLDRSRAAEIRGRERLEKDAVALLATLGPQDRRALSTMLSRRGGGRDGRDGPRRDADGGSPAVPSPTTQADRQN